MAEVNFENSYAELPAHFYTHQVGQASPKPEILAVNEELGQFLNLPEGFLSSEAGLNLISGVAFPKSAKPLAQAYAGHQFGGFSPQLGDGRALLIGEVIAKDGNRYDIQLKGSGLTPYSRNGDGKAGLGPVIREYVVSEAMHALGVPTTRSLAAIRTGEDVYRSQREDGAMLTRVALSHIRVGTFQFFAARNDIEALEQLSKYTITRHYPQAAEHENPTRGLFEAVCETQAKLIAQWMSLGFIHGVMNTDNVSISGQTIDYGPCAFMDGFDAMKVFSSIDTGGRYAWARQPQIGNWNLLRFAETLIPIWGKEEDKSIEEVQASIGIYGERVNTDIAVRFAAKLGLTSNADTDSFTQNTLGFMQKNSLDFTRFFAHLREDFDAEIDWKNLADGEAWFADWQKRVEKEDNEISLQRRRSYSPIYIPRNHQIARIIASAEAGDDQPIFDLMSVLAKPFTMQNGVDDYSAAPKPSEEVRQTFCGT